MTIPAFDRRARLAVIVAAITLAVSGVGFRSAVGYLNVHLQKEPVPLQAPLAAIPATLGEWKSEGADRLLDEISTEELGTSKYLMRRYVRDRNETGGELNLHVAYYTGMIDAVPHVPDRCFVAGGWNTTALTRDYPLDVSIPDVELDPELVSRVNGEAYRVVRRPRPVTGQMETIRLPFGEFEIRTAVFGHDEHPDLRLYGGYFFIANNRMTPSPEYIRSLAFRPTEKYAYYAKVELIMQTSKQDGPEVFLAPAAEFIEELLPELMRCLPDWSVVEAVDPAAGTDA